MVKKENVIIMGAAGRDFHNFLVYYKDNPNYNVVGFTAEQIPGIAGRKFPAKLAGKYYRKGIPIYKEVELTKLIKKHHVTHVDLAYSDLPHDVVMHKASIVQAAGASFTLLGPKETQIKSKKPLISVTAVRTGCGKSQTTRKVARILRDQGYRIAAIRHPMPYGDLVKQEVQRFATYADMKKHKCTIEEREEYDPWVKLGIPIYAGVNYTKILNEAEKEADVILWDGGNNDFSFYVPDLNIVVVDPHRPGHELHYYPGETNFRSADVIVINKVDSASTANIKLIKDNIKQHNPCAKVITAASDLIVSDPKLLRGKKTLIVGDGPTLTHGGMSFGAGTIAAKKYKAKILSPAKYAKGVIKNVYKKYPHLNKGTELPAMGYSPQQNKDLAASINKSPATVVIDGTPVSLQRQLKLKKPIVNVDYYLKERGKPTLRDVLKTVKITKRKQ